MHDTATPASHTNWHALAAEVALRQLETTPEGLSDDQAAERLHRYGPNRLKPAQRTPAWVRLLLQFHNILIYVLIIAGIATALLGHWIDTGVIFGVVIINALIGFFQEGKAEKALEAIGRMLSLEATVVRGGKRAALPADELVPGDVVVLRAGDKVPADLRLLESRELRIEEAMLTGESLPAEKDPAALPAESALGDRACLAFSGTLVTTGQGLGVVTGTGDHTELGKISRLVAETHAVTTPLIAQINRFGNVLAVVVLALAAVTFGAGWLVGGIDVVELFLAAVALAVAAIPEGLPAILTIVLAIGVQRMAKRNAIIRRLPAVDTLGALTVICSDKTGTLTRNEMTVTAALTADQQYAVSGVGYAPTGQVQLDGAAAQLDDHTTLGELIRAGLLCNDSELHQHEGHWKPAGDPMESALITLAMKAGLKASDLRTQWKTIDTLPFDSRTRYMATLHRADGEALLLVKGAPERLLEMCDREQVDGQTRPLDRAAWELRSAELASQGQRLLAIAKGDAPDGDTLTEQHVQAGLTLLGLVGIVDPPRQEAIDSVRQCHEAGIRVVMITGDHALTAAAIGRGLDIGDGKTVLTGEELDRLDEVAFARAADECNVFARVSPEHKLRLVTAIQTRGAVAAMTGDGVNDAPALKRADVGIAMGIKGTETTKEAAAMVLADDNFASIAHAVEEGRTVYDNLRKAIVFILPTNGGEALVVLLAILLGTTLPLTPVQVLWINLVTTITLAMALSFEPPEDNVMKRRPRDPKGQLLTGYLLWRILLVSVVVAACIFGLFIYLRGQGASLELARTVAVNAIVMCEAFYLLNSRSMVGPILNARGLLGSRPVLIAIALVVVFQLLFTYLPIAHTLFGTTALDAWHWLLLIAAASSVLWIVELEKWVARRWLGMA